MNALGRTLRYMTEAWAYAVEPLKAKPAGGNRLADIVRTTQNAPTASQANVDYYLRLAITNPVYFGNVSTISSRVSDADALVVQEQVGDKWEDRPGHEFMRVLSVPNGIFSGDLVMEDVAWWYNLLGNAYLYLVTDTPGVGPVREIWPLPARVMEPDPRTYRISPYTKKPVIDYNYMMGAPITLPGENVVHVRSANPFDYWQGLAPISALQTVLDTDTSEAEWLASFFKEGNAIPTAIVSLPPALQDSQFDKIKRDIVEQFGARRRAAVTRAGDMDVKLLQHSVQEMRVVEGMDHNEKRINRVTHFPGGLHDAQSGQSRLAADMAIMRDAVQPFFNKVAGFLTLKMVLFYGPEFRVWAKDVVPQDRALETSEYQTRSPHRTINESRAAMQADPIQFTGELAALQPLVDQVPEILLPTATSLLLRDKLTPPQLQQSAPQIGAREDEEDGQPGPHTTGQETQEQMERRLTRREVGVDEKAVPLSDAEAEAALYVVSLNGRSKHA